MRLLKIWKAQKDVQVGWPTDIKFSERAPPVIGYEAVSIPNTDLFTDGFLHWT